MDRMKRLLDEKGSAVFSVTPETTVWDAACAMAEHHVGAVLIMAERQVAGIFSERDLLLRVLLAGRDAKATPVQEVMSSELVYVTPDTTVHEAMAIMTERRCRHLPVMEGSELRGMVSIGDCTRFLSRDQDYTILHLTQYIHNQYPG
jgi:CBS domain-containing protein